MADDRGVFRRSSGLHDLPMFARRGSSNDFGKMRDLGTLRLPAETAELVRAAAARLGKPTLEYVREILEVGHHGRSEVERRTTVRLDAIEQVLLKRDRKGSPK